MSYPIHPRAEMAMTNKPSSFESKQAWTQGAPPPRPFGRMSTTQVPLPVAGSKKLVGLDPSSEDIDSVIIHDLHWWTSDLHLVLLCKQLGIQIKHTDVHFLEHKVNGKSKGQATVICHTKENAIKLNEHFQANMFQGKKVPSALATWAYGNPLHPGNQEFPSVRPLSTAIHSTVRQPTNAHGGVNFNRVRPTSRTAIQGSLGNGQPNSRTSSTDNFSPIPLQPQMDGGLIPVDPAIAWSSHQGEYNPYNFVPMEYPYHYGGLGYMMGPVPPHVQ
ncbi:uncharacterized protein IL334_004154 [Kwoniella shivajii]|uniref:RRM domain-containing protein n=1 Tax=Kwoniella shivajii TaxID=564305 RepID=A0ABZ1CZN2_9TREE|nr:hypothetical protein IL334_004154 [Kwoniella shivajii]